MSKHNGRNNEVGEGKGGRQGAGETHGEEGRRGDRRFFFAKRAAGIERYCRLAMRRFHVRVAALIARKRKIRRRASVIAGMAQYADALFRLHEERRGANPIAIYTEKGFRAIAGGKAIGGEIAEQFLRTRERERER